MSLPERSTITAIETQVHNRHRVSVFVDGEWTLGVHAEVAAAAGICVGMPVRVTDLQALARDEELRWVRESALKFLGYRARSRMEIKQRLERHGYDPALIDEALAALGRSGLIDDAEFSRSWVSARTASGSRPMGPNRLKAELRQKGIERDLVDQAMEPLDAETELGLALKVGRQKVEQLHREDPHTARRKLTAALMRRGFGWEVCSKVLNIVLNPDSGD